MLVSEFPQGTQKITGIIYLWFPNYQIYVGKKTENFANSFDQYVMWGLEESPLFYADEYIRC